MRSTDNLSLSRTRLRWIVFVAIVGLNLLAVECVTPVYAQGQWLQQSLTRGKVWITMNNALQIGCQTGDYPCEHYAWDYPGWTPGSELADKPTYGYGGGYVLYGEQGGEAVGFTQTNVFGVNSQFLEQGEATEKLTNYNLDDPSIPAEEMLTGSHIFKPFNAEIAHRTMVWSFPKYDDFVVHEITITNHSNSEINNFHFAMRTLPSSIRGELVGPGTWNDEKYGWSEEQEVFYIWDDRSFLFETGEPVSFNFGPGPQVGDQGDPSNIQTQNATNSELLSPAFFSPVALDCKGTEVYQNILQYTHQDPSTDAPEVDRMAFTGRDPASRFLEVITHQQPRAAWDELSQQSGEGGNKYERNIDILIGCGPFSIEPGSSVMLAFAEVLGEMDRSKIVEGGVENVEAMMTESRDSVLKHVEVAREFYESDYAIENPPPPTPTDGEGSLTVAPMPAGIEVSWPAIPDAYTDPITGESDLAGYRVYRSNYFTVGPWQQVADISTSETDASDGIIRFDDTGLPLGIGQYYAVTSYDEAGNESGIVNNSRFPVYPMRAPNTEFPEERVHVVPNPFRQHSRLMGSGEELRMEFVNVPSRAIIKIYSISGDLIQTIEHADGSGSASWGSNATLDYMTSEWMQHVQPGVYIYHVQSKVPGEEDKDFIGKFAIIR